MSLGMVATRYARALLEYAKDNKVEDKVFAEMKILSRSYREVPELRTTMDNPVLDSQSKFSLICAAAGNPSKEFVNFIQLVMDRRRETLLQEIALVYMDLYREYKKVDVVKLVTAIPPTDEIVSRMKALLKTSKLDEERTLEFDTEIDPSIEGGFVLYVDTYRLDASVKTQIREIRQQLVERNRKIV